MGISLNSISKTFGDNIVFRDFSLEFEEGISTCIMGASGLGKTTLLNILAGLLEADQGYITGLEGKKLAPVFQEDRLCENLSAGANIRLAARQKLSAKEISDMLNILLLPSAIRQPVREMSGGMKRRVSLARALLSGGNLFLFDEPFKGLDEETRSAVIAAVRKKLTGKTLIWVSHDLNEANEMGSSIIRLNELMVRKQEVFSCIN